jgi:superfamily II DNA or RNA helicase
VDECHHLSAQSFEQVARRAKARYVTGLSATVTRKDGHHPIIFMQCGPVRYRVDAKEQALARPFTHTVVVRPTGFYPLKAAKPDARSQFQELYGDLIADEDRNRFICEDIVQAVREGRSPVVLTERTEHLEHLAELLSPEIRHVRATGDRAIHRGGIRRCPAGYVVPDATSVMARDHRAVRRQIAPPA